VAKFRISTHGRLHEWVAVEKGYFDDEGLDYVIDMRVLENADQDIAVPALSDVRTGAYELYQGESGGKQNMSCACHWATNQASTDSAGRMWGRAYSVLPSGIYVAADSKIRRPEDLAGVEVAVGYHSGSHFSTIQALEAFLDPEEIKLRFVGMPYDRVDALLSGEVNAAAIWNAPSYIVEQLGYRKIVDSTFMAGFMFGAQTETDDVERYFKALRRAQMELDLAAEKYKHYYSEEIPARYAELVDVRAFGPGERIAFLPYTEETYDRSQLWMKERALFPSSESGRSYEEAVLV
jgi:ABC-type nitrate/sulfonate/bicarbonate transport system substrate-binding protein